jgi:hypothetical protein
MRLADFATASQSPSLRASIAPVSAPRPARIWREMVAESSPSCGVGLKRIFSASAPCSAAQLWVAITAAPPGIATTSSTPATDFTESRSKPSSSAPNTGESTAQAYTMPGRSTSEANTGSPRTLAPRSTRGTFWPV